MPLIRIIMNDESEIDWQKDCWRGANGSRIWALSRGVHNFSIFVRFWTAFGPTVWSRAMWTVDPWLRVSSFLLSARILKRIRRNIARVSFSFKHGFIILNKFVCRIFSWREIKIFSSSNPRCWRFRYWKNASHFSYIIWVSISRTHMVRIPHGAV